MQKTWLTDIRTWVSPGDDDAGMKLLATTLSSHDIIGLPLARFEQLQSLISLEFRDATPLIKSQRMIKSATEIAILAK